ncbi:MAG: hypothetical protein NTZ05_07420 [Chloroflexi bacterium]|nr:hypothetical protein [Chloroflexota bacterium]
MVSTNSPYSQVLGRAFARAQALSADSALLAAHEQAAPLTTPLKTIDGNGKTVLLGKSIAEGVRTIVGNLNKNKYLYSILITCLVEKVVHPHQDIRIAQTDLAGGYSNRSTDQTNVTPFLKQSGLTHCAASGAESGRNFERPIPFGLGYVGKPQGVGNREAFLGILHAVQEEYADPEPCLTLMMTLDLLRNRPRKYSYPNPTGVTVNETYALFQNIINYPTAKASRGCPFWPYRQFISH